MSNYTYVCIKTLHKQKLISRVRNLYINSLTLSKTVVNKCEKLLNTFLMNSLDLFAKHRLVGFEGKDDKTRRASVLQPQQNEKAKFSSRAQIYCFWGIGQHSMSQ